jgi:hypothetical protein
MCFLSDCLSLRNDVNVGYLQKVISKITYFFVGFLKEVKGADEDPYQKNK